MEKKFYPLSTKCEECNRPLTILEICFSEEGKVLINWICVVCGKATSGVSSWEKIIAHCHDMELYSDCSDTVN